MPVLEVEGLCKSFRSNWTFRRRPVIRSLDLQVEPGEHNERYLETKRSKLGHIL